jgi:hypothetical protein
MWQKHARACNKFLKSIITNNTDTYEYVNDMQADKDIHILVAEFTGVYYG